MMVCQDTGIPIYWVDIGGKLRLEGSNSLTPLCAARSGRRGASAAFEHRSPPHAKSPDFSTVKASRSFITISFPTSDVLDILFMPKGSGRKTCRS